MTHDSAFGYNKKKIVYLSSTSLAKNGVMNAKRVKIEFANSYF